MEINRPVRNEKCRVIDALGKRLAITHNGSYQNSLRPESQAMAREIAVALNCYKELASALQRIANGNDTATMREWATNGLRHLYAAQGDQTERWRNRLAELEAEMSHIKACIENAEATSPKTSHPHS